MGRLKNAIFIPIQYEDKSLKYVDELNCGRVLLLETPTTRRTCKWNSLAYHSIDKIKEYLSSIDSLGINLLTRNVGKIGDESLPIVLDAINMYTEQIVRQSELTDSRSVDLFTYQQEEKMEIVMDKYAEIIAYLLCDTKEFVWGGLSDSQRKKYLSSVVNNNLFDQELRYRMVENIANYTTLPELEKVKQNNYKVLKRFIKK